MQKKKSKEVNPPEKTFALSQAQYEELEQEKIRSQERFEQILRLRAEFENFRKRVAKEKEEFARFANAELIRRFLDIIDDFERAIESSRTHKNSAELTEGLGMILERINNVLGESGLKKMEVIGKPFDPHRHEAVLQAENDEHPENTVIEELQPGYLLEDRVIRIAKVKISKRTEDREQRTEHREQRTENGRI